MPVTFTGWTRLSGQTWQPAVAASMEGDAWQLLHEHVDRLGEKTIDLFVGPSSTDPRGHRRPDAVQLDLFR